ncbi:MAG: zinc ABC transporter substrate-binding protein [Treponema sp.]|jgi:zinc transport system substrate-binding protein|nr:zinc ABC transporter substrate-binding protein [Treponema sp.]
MHILRLCSAFFIPIVLFPGVFGCAKERNAAPRSASSKPIIAVSILPQAWFVTRIAGDRVRTLVLIGPGQNPHSYEPAPKQMAGLAAARVWVLSGTEFEISLTPKIRALFPGLSIIDGTEGVDFRFLEAHEEDEAREDHTGTIDRHTWLGSKPAKIMASHIRSALSEADNEGVAFYREQYGALVKEIDEEFDALRQELAPLKGKTVFVYHPGFGYFLDEFGIIQRAIEAGGKEPGPRDLSDLIEQAKQEGVPAIFVQAQFPAESARTAAAAAGAELVPLDPLSPEWLDNIRLMGQALKKASAGIQEAVP